MTMELELQNQISYRECINRLEQCRKFALELRDCEVDEVIVKRYYPEINRLAGLAAEVGYLPGDVYDNLDRLHGLTSRIEDLSQYNPVWGEVALLLDSSIESIKELL